MCACACACVRARVFLVQTSTSALELTHTLMEWVPGFGFLGRPDREVGHSPPFCAEGRNDWSHIPVPLICLQSVDRDFTVTGWYGLYLF